MFRGANKNRSLILTLSKEKRAILGGKVLIFSGLLFEEGEGLIKNTHLPPSNFEFYLAVSGYFGDIPLFRSSTKMLKELRGRLIFQVAFAFLYLDELGWNDAAQSDAHATDSWNIFRFYLEHYGFDLVLYLVEFDEFYYIDNIECKQVLKLANRPDWDGKYILDRVEISSCPEIEPEVIFEYREVKDLWDHLQIHGLSMEEIIDKSVVMVEH